MATEPITPVVTTTQVGDEPQKVSFSVEQQDKIQQLIDAAVARTSSKTRTEHEARVAALTAELEAAKAAPKTTSTTVDTVAQTEEYKRIVEAAKQETERYRQEAITREREVISARAESQEIRKEVAITQAAATIPFFNVEAVKTLTKSNIVFDADSNQFVVKGSNGQIRYDSTLEKPLSLEAYFAEFASQNKYLVRSVLPSGTGSSETSRAGVASNGAYAVTDIFGPKSSSAKASDLMKTNPAEYQRLKAIARTERLIA